MKTKRVRKPGCNGDCSKMRTKKKSVSAYEPGTVQVRYMGTRREVVGASGRSYGVRDTYDLIYVLLEDRNADLRRFDAAAVYVADPRHLPVVQDDDGGDGTGDDVRADPSDDGLATGCCG